MKLKVLHQDPEPQQDEMAARQPASSAESWWSKVTTHCETKGFLFFRLAECDLD